MSNDYFESSTYHLTSGTRARASALNSALDAIETGLDKLPTEARIKRGTINFIADTGAADAYVVTLTYAPSSYVDGMEVVFKAANANTGVSTINVNALGAKTITRQDGGALSAGDIPAGKIITARYNSSSDNFEIQGSSATGTGTMASQNAVSVSISGGTISGVGLSGLTAPLAVADGGTGGATQAAAITGLGITATKEEISQLAGVSVGGNTAGDIITTSDTQTMTGKTLTSPALTSPVLNTGVSGTAVLDEDNMASDSATKLATQQSIKAYIDSGTVTMTNKRLTSPKLNEDVVLTPTATEVNRVCKDNTATAAEIVKAADGIGVSIPRQKVIEIGNWNMETTPAVNVAHGLTIAKIVGVRVVILDDLGGILPLTGGPTTTVEGYWNINSANVTLTRFNGGYFASNTYNASPFNRGWVILDYID